MRQRLLNILIALDQLVWVLVTLGAGDPDETMSAAAWRTEQKGRVFGRLFRPLIDLLFARLEQHHCRKAFEAELSRAQLHRDYRGAQ